VVGIDHDDDGLANGVRFTDAESDRAHTVRGRAVINATGAFGDALRRLDDPAAEPIIAPSQGVHLVLDGAFLPGQTAIMVPRTRDKRVMFAIPWQGRTLVGTTDTPINRPTLEPVALEQEIEFLLDTASRYLARRPERDDVLSVFVGIRPLVKTSGVTSSAALARDHTIEVAKSGLLTIAGGKWTTYRKMAEDCVDQASILARLDERPCVTRTLRVHGYIEGSPGMSELASYGSEAPQLEAMIAADPSMGRRFDERIPINPAMVVWAVRHEMARTVEDVLARRTRSLLLHAAAAIDAAPSVARYMAAELQRDRAWQDEQVKQFTTVAQHYLIRPRDRR
jgi:glycerol-3-phosphate dehydrogenase